MSPRWNQRKCPRCRGFYDQDVFQGKVHCPDCAHEKPLETLPTYEQLQARVKRLEQENRRLRFRLAFKRTEVEDG